MFDNVGGKLKGFSKAFLWFSIIINIALAIGMFVLADAYYRLEGYFIAVGIYILIGGPVSSWLNSALIYGFGELIEKTCSMAKTSREKTDNRPSNIEVKKSDERTDKLERLRAQGLISEEEYQKAAKKNSTNGGK